MKNFKALEAQQMALFTEKKQKLVFDRVANTMDVFRFLGAIVEMYVPVMANTIVGLTNAEGGAEQETPSAGVEQQPSKDKQNKERPAGPKGTDDIIR